mgnify:FL=1
MVSLQMISWNPLGESRVGVCKNSQALVHFPVDDGLKSLSAAIPLPRAEMLTLYEYEIICQKLSAWATQYM